MNIIIAGGGTGGHLFPGMAIAEEFRIRDAGTRIVFIGTERGLENRVLPGSGYELKLIDIAGIKGRGLRSLGAMAKIPRSLFQSVGIIREVRPDIVIGVGGYASGPAVAAAHLLGIRTAIAEQNAFPGLTNRILGRFVDRIFLTFPDKEKKFSAKKVIVSGNPVRSAFCRSEKRKVDSSFTVLVFGGSQGARNINNAVLEALPFLKTISGLKVVHQTGPAEYDRIAEAYRIAIRGAGINAEILPFIADMASACNAADLLVCRSGATSIAEITACGKAAILIPFPFAVADHQTQNARVLVDAGAAEMIPEKNLTGQYLASRIQELYNHREQIAKMETNSAKLANLNSAVVIVNECISLIGKK